MHRVAGANVVANRQQLEIGRAMRLEIEAGEIENHIAPLSCKWLRWEVMIGVSV